MRATFEPAIVIDATDATLGRLASYAAKQALLGKSIAIVNCNEAIVTGRKRMVIKEYQEMRQKGGAALKGPFFPKIPEQVVKRTIRGMLSYKQGRGEAAFKRIRCYNETPVEFAEAPKIKAGKEKTIAYITLKKLSTEI